MVSCDMIQIILKMRPKMALIDPSPVTKFHRKMEHNEKVYCAQELGSYAQGQGHNQVRGQIVPKIVSLKNY